MTSNDEWMRRMRRGDWESAWRICDVNLRQRAGKPCWHLPRHLQYIWDGSPLEGKRVLVRCYHGMGDTVQFIRFMPMLKARAREVIVWAQPALIPLLRTVDGIDALQPLHDGVPKVDYDVDIEIMELPHALRVRLDTLPTDTPYIHVESPHRKPSDQPVVGIVWRSGDWDERRSVPVRLMEQLVRLPGIAWQIFQRGPAIAEWACGLGLMLKMDDIVAEAQALRALDLLISVDTLSAHLAGALGVRTWLLLHADPDWRWMEGIDHSPWYPQMRLFRQPRAGDWQSVLDSVAQALPALAIRPASGIHAPDPRACSREFPPHFPSHRAAQAHKSR